MADVANAVRTRLTEHAGTAALIVARAYHGALLQDSVLPASIVQQISAPRISAMGDDVDKYEARVQVKACASTRAGAQALQVQHLAALQRYGGTVASVVIHDCFIADDTGPEYEDETKLWVGRLDVMVWVTA